VLAREGGHELLVADVGLASPTPEGVRPAKVAPGSGDITTAAAMSEDDLVQALTRGGELAAELAGRGVDCLVLGEIGIGNTTTAAALACALTGVPVERAIGRGTGVDAAGLERKRAIVRAALRRHGAGLSASEALRRLGGLELAALAGATVEAVRLRLPVLLDGYAVSAAALAAVRLEAAAGEVVIATHRSAEPGHGVLLEELGLEPLLDLRLRLGEASGAMLALGLIERAGALHGGMGTFAEAAVDGPL
jgi:nicotinate-nucleotide--dimethylbenzimidazole phosphoribosyltransferase